MKAHKLITAVVGAGLLLVSVGFARDNLTSDHGGREQAAATPAYCNTAHNVGRIALGISNDGCLATRMSVSGSTIDCFTGMVLPSCEYPVGSNTRYIFGGALWVGAIVGTDTLVSTGADGWSVPGNEWHPDELPHGAMLYRSTLDPRSPAFVDAASEQDFVAVYTDTCLSCKGVSNDLVDGRPHVPLNLEVTQTSHAWSWSRAEDIVFIDYRLKNIGSQTLNQMFIGQLLDADIHDLEDRRAAGSAQDDLSGYLKTVATVPGGGGRPVDVEVELSWSADNDGDLRELALTPVPHVVGLSWLNLYDESIQKSFNWYTSNAMNPDIDYGPMRRVNFRDFGTYGTGTPEGDRNKYFLLSNGDVDFDQVITGTIGSNDPVWVPPSVSPLFALGLDTRLLVSAGPFTLAPGQEVTATVAVIVGENLHSDADNLMDNLPDNPSQYLANLDFDDLLLNAVYAGWIYDNPGVDTDGDGNFGESYTLNDDTIWYRGDGVPDWRIKGPPEAPCFWLEPEQSALKVRINGAVSEMSRDWLSRQFDFEGYRVYLSDGPGPMNFALAASYDVEDYARFYWDAENSAWQADDRRWYLEDLRCLYAPGGCADLSWHPLDYPRSAPFVCHAGADSAFYFETILVNASALGLETPLVKTYPDAVKPTYSDPSEVPSDSAAYYLTDDGYFKYYEYELLLEELIPEHLYWVDVTAIDYGSPAGDGPSTETAVGPTAECAAPLPGGSECCVGTVGNADGDPSQEVNIVDLAALVAFLYIDLRQHPLNCYAEADINRSGGQTPGGADITIGDIVQLIDYLFLDPRPLPDCP
jgi:hypothetical protein